MDTLRYIYRYFRNNVFRILAIVKGKKLETGDNIVIISPHPDDEVLGCGGMITYLRQNRRKVSVIFLTHGEHLTKSIDEETLANERRNLTDRAMLAIGEPVDDISFLNFGDGKINAENPEVSRLIKILDRIEPSAIFIPHHFEGWNDHVQANLIIHSYIKGKQIKIYEYCVWFWYTMPFDKIFSIRWRDARIFKMSRRIRNTKLNAIHIYTDAKNNEGMPFSGNLPKIMLKSCSWRHEIYFKG